MAEKENKTGLIIISALGIAAVIVGIYFIATAATSASAKKNVFKSLKKSQTELLQSDIQSINTDYIAVLSVKGVIEEKNETYDHDWLIDLIEELAEDTKNKAILLTVDSPGGGLFEADEVYLALGDYKSAGKPVWAYLEQTAASGGYYISCAADVIYANRNTLTGSIGVLMGPAVDISDLMQKYGIKTTTFSSGKNKNMLSFDKPVTSEQAAIMQSIVDEAYEQFVNVVAEGRKMDVQAVTKIADGRIYTAKQAQQIGLVDNIGRFDDMLSAMQTAVSGENAPLELEYFSPGKEDTLYEMFKNFDFLFSSRAKGAEQLELVDRILKDGSVPQYRLR